MNDCQLRYKCCRCNNDAVTRHEPFYGTADRKICIKYDIRFPVCHKCHQWSHNQGDINDVAEDRKEEQARFYCGLANLNYDKIKIMFQRSRECVPLFLKIKEHMQGFLDHFER